MQSGFAGTPDREFVRQRHRVKPLGVELGRRLAPGRRLDWNFLFEPSRVGGGQSGGALQFELCDRFGRIFHYGHHGQKLRYQ